MSILLSITQYLHLFILCVFLCCHAMAHVEVQDEPSGISTILLPCWFWMLNSVVSAFTPCVTSLHLKFKIIQLEGQWIKLFVTKPDDLSSVPQTHMVEGVNGYIHVLLSHTEHCRAYKYPPILTIETDRCTINVLKNNTITTLFIPLHFPSSTIPFHSLPYLTLSVPLFSFNPWCHYILIFLSWRTLLP